MTLAVLAALFGFAYWFSSGGGVDKAEVRLLFNDKVSGLGQGTNVLFNGLRVGEVTQISLQPDDPRQIYAIIKVDQSTPLRADTRARIEAQGFAGVVAVQLLGGDPNSPVLTAQAGEPFPTITAERSEDILETARTIAKRVDDALGGIEGLVKDNAGPISDTIRSTEQFAAALGDSSGGVDKLMKSIGSVAEFTAPLTQKLGAFSQELTETIRSVDQQNITSVVENVEEFTATLGGAGSDVGKRVKDVASIAEKLNRSANHVEDVLKGAQAFLNTASGQDGRNAFSDIRDVAKSIRVLADNLDQRTAEITAEITRLTGAGLRSVETLTTDGRRALTGFSRNLRAVERDPQRLILGSKPQLPQYNGAR
ncbi:MlaD family protein [Bosea psychrotolerans]|uniref:MlaD family protein n=1 Tax=Bosea psychrotolerans TaxID=1871628 RepID=UPI0015E1B820|nr:MlaD family protein [Bosea psychrotolerans]